MTFLDGPGLDIPVQGNIVILQLTPVKDVNDLTAGKILGRRTKLLPFILYGCGLSHYTVYSTFLEYLMMINLKT